MSSASDDYSVPEDILNALQQHARTHGDHLATCYGQRKRTYAELDDMSNKLADAMLMPPNFLPPSDVAVCVSSVDDTILCGLATLKLGACCIPLSPTWFHIGTVIDEVPPTCIVVDESSASFFKQGLASEPLVINLEQALNHPNQDSRAYQPSFKAQRPMFHLLSDTGERTGLTTFCCMSRVRWEVEKYPFKDDEIVATLCDFDSSNFWMDVIGAFYVGATVAIPTKEDKRGIPSVISFAVESRVTRLLVNPDKLAKMIRYRRVEPELFRKLSLRLVKCVSGILPVRLAETCRAALPRADLVFLYDHYALSCYYDCSSEPLLQHEIPEGAFVPLGKPVGHCKVYIKDAAHNNCPTGTVGQIFLGECDGKAPFYTGDTGFLDERGCLYFVSRTSPVISGKKTDMTVLARCICEVPGIDEVIICWEKFTRSETTLLAFYWSDTGVPWGDVLRHLVKKVPSRWVPKLFPMGGHQPPGFASDKHYHSQKSLLKEYSEAMQKLEACAVSSHHQGAQVLFFLARLLDKSVSWLDMSTPFTAQGATQETCSKAATLVSSLGLYVNEQDIQRLPLSAVVPSVVKTLYSKKAGVLRTCVVDKQTSFEEVSTLLSECFVAKNRLDLAVGNTRDQHVNALRQMWPEFMTNGACRVVVDETGKVVGVCLCGDFFSEAVVEGMSDTYAAIIELHEELERPARARFRGVGRALMCFMVGTAMHLDHATNTSLVYLLMSHMLQDAREHGYAVMFSANSHIITAVLTENYLDFDILDWTDPAQFSFKGKIPFQNIQAGTRAILAYRFV
ncbi:beta-alanyl-bioamine nonribosomal peptide synthetase ebony-like isoform X2 [Ornithodoros turicata]|uniref:beta-alanyl-bioamine nonribosomal peptide synthetase ebony-like isoform X2 n=1 Tax=Ornithodoros turicata TaxID=34597 RepID=UPI0031397888